MSNFIEDFELRFEKQLPSELLSCEVKNKTILLAVSGGADSIAMLVCSLSLIKNPIFQNKYKDLKIKVVTVNHKIRSEEESFGDCLFVKDFCELCQIPCFIENAQDNEIQNLSVERGMGTEEAARFFRYSIFEKVALQEKADFIFLAHNKDDQLETLIQRFFQGATGSSSLGIPQKRDVFYRPMMDFSKQEIYQYLEEKNVDYRTDTTNFENDYLRNKIRNLIIPCINENFKGWENALLKGVQKKSIDEDFFEQECKRYPWEFSENQAYMEKSIFNNLHKAIKIRLVYEVLSKIKANHRIPFEIIESFCDGNKNNSGGVNFFYTKDKVFINNIKNSSTDSYFFAIIDEVDGLEKTLSTPKGILRFFNKDEFSVAEKKSFKKVFIPCFVELKNDEYIFNAIPSEKEDFVFVKIEDF
jgi:tRNA(Ile)-lysidine synthase